MNSSRLAEWILFHRLYVSRYNAFMDMCSIGFKPVLDDLGILSCHKRINRKTYAVFEAVDEIARPYKIVDSDCYVISVHRRRCLDFLLKVSTLYSEVPLRSLEPYEAMLLSDWIGSDITRLLPVKYDNQAL